MQTSAVFLKGPRDLHVETLPLKAPQPGQIVVDIDWSGISTGTEKLFWTGDMPPFPGMGYPLVPGYEAAGTVVEAAPDAGFRVGEAVFVPGANCFEGAFGLFGGAASRLITDAKRVCRIDAGMGEDGALLALAATARHAMAGLHRALPELIVGHGVLGRLLARLTLAAGGPAPVSATLGRNLTWVDVTLINAYGDREWLAMLAGVGSSDSQLLRVALPTGMLQVLQACFDEADESLTVDSIVELMTKLCNQPSPWARAE